jgi:hypothetical protein
VLQSVYPETRPLSRYPETRPLSRYPETRPLSRPFVISRTNDGSAGLLFPHP